MEGDFKPDQWEYLISLQQQIDRLVELDEKRRERIQRLERDRETLRRRLEGNRRSRRFRSSRTDEVSDDEAEDSVADGSGVEVPGVGRIAAAPRREFAPARELKVATILDQFSTVGFGPEFQAVPLGARTWRETVDEVGDFDLLLVESAYLGNDNSWATRVARFGDPSPYLVELTKWFSDRNVPTVFWNKEDPANFDWFISSARLFDHVFTVDGDTIPRYRSLLGHDRVHLLQFFAQPLVHFPGPWEERRGTVAFAGSYYAAKHSERRQQMEMLLEPALEFGLHIFDRHAGTDARFSWPDKYRSHIVGRLSYAETLEAYRRYKVFLNVNTVTDSPTMCSRRVFELAASGAPIVTTPSRAIEVMMPQGAVVTVRSASETKQVLSELLSDEDRLSSMAECARRWVLGGHTASHRVDEMLEVVGLGA